MIKAAAYWFTVGVFLGVPYHTLQTIRKDNRDESKECLREMLAAWLTGREASPAEVVQALKAAGMVVLAKKIAVKYGENNGFSSSVTIMPLQKIGIKSTNKL